jgi:hypothetical protein
MIDPRTLIEKAFIENKSNGTQKWDVMTLSELKVKLLELTDSEFDQTKYGVKKFKPFLEKHPDLVKIIDDEFGLRVRFIKEYSQLSDSEKKYSSKKSKYKFDDLLMTYQLDRDWLALGYLELEQINTQSDQEIEKIFCKVFLNWALPDQSSLQIESIKELKEHVDDIDEDDLSIVVVRVLSELKKIAPKKTYLINDIIYRLENGIVRVFSIAKQKRQQDFINVAIAKLRKNEIELMHAIDNFVASTTGTAKHSSIILIKQMKEFRKYALPAERVFLTKIDGLLGPLFRKFCESCENHDLKKVAVRTDELGKYLSNLRSDHTGEVHSVFWKNKIEPIYYQVESLLEQGVEDSEKYSIPDVKAVVDDYKIDLNDSRKELVIPMRVRNFGLGSAHKIKLKCNCKDVSITIVEPTDPFELIAGGERVIKVLLTLLGSFHSLKVTLEWESVGANSKIYLLKQRISLDQQKSQPDWDRLLENPPYSTNPVRNREKLFGRDAILNKLIINVFGGTSTFLWGQKRVGKTSLLQVLASEVEKKSNVDCIVLRMGELSSLHEGQIAQTIAQRLLNSYIEEEFLTEEYYGAGLGRLVPIVENVCKKLPDLKLLVIIDEFDDLDKAFYLGERGKQFIKAIRSLSEVGLCFFFVGSERMNSIYESHASDLNKWLNQSLDHIDTFEDCAKLIENPVEGAIEFETKSVRFISEYCKGNPFYIHIFCNAIFMRCLQDRRTFVSESDADDIRKSMLQMLGRTNFAHFWEDNPDLDPIKKNMQTAKNCLYLTCLSRLGGHSGSIEDILSSQNSLNLLSYQLLDRAELQKTELLLINRKVIGIGNDGVISINLPILKDWLQLNCDSELMPIWVSHCDLIKDENTDNSIKEESINDDNFPFSIPEDELLSVTENLIYLGKQKDVAEVRSWLRQFDDDNRIYIAFKLLSQLSLKGFVSNGSYINSIDKTGELIGNFRLDIGDQAWKMFRRKKDNLCITYVDSDVKSGANVARELSKRIGPGKCDQISKIDSWMASHLDSDPIIVIVDDFSGTGNTIVKGLSKVWGNENKYFSKLASEGRVVLILQSALPTAVERIKHEYPDIKLRTIHVFDESVMAFKPPEGIFSDVAEFNFAKEVMTQIGRQLTSQAPLGYGDMAALICFHNTIPNNTLPIFWSNGKVNGKQWKPLFPRASF